MAELTDSQKNGSKLNGISGKPLQFTTKGESGNNSVSVQSPAFFSVSDEDSNNLITNSTVSGKYTFESRSLLNFIKWIWLPNHNIPGKVNGTLNCAINGKGSSASNAMDMDGGTASLTFSGLNYTAPTDEKSQRYTDETITLVFPANEKYNEDGATIIAKDWHDLGQIAYNTPAPTIYYDVVPEDITKLYLVDSNGNKVDTFKYNGGQFDDVKIKLLPNTPGTVTKGTVSGTMVVACASDTTTMHSRPQVDYHAQTLAMKCTNNYGPFVMTSPDNSQAVTTDRKLSLDFTFSKETNNVGSTIPQITSRVDIYQNGGDFTVPDPTITYKWLYYDENSDILGGDPAKNYFDKVVTNNETAIFYWKENTNSKGYSKGNIVWKNKPTNPGTNEGSEQYLTLSGLTMVEPTNASQRSADATCIITTENAQNDPVGYITGTYIYSNTNTTIKAGVSATTKLIQTGTSWESPDMNIKLTVTPATTNPSNVTNDSTRIPSCTINGSTSSTIRVYTDGKGNMLHDTIKLEMSNNMPISTSYSNTGTIPISHSGGTPGNSISVFDTIYIYEYSKGGPEVSWELNSIPAMAECKYTISGEITGYGSTTTNDIDSSLVTNKIETITITDGGNERQAETYKNETVTVTNSNPNYFSVSPSSFTVKAMQAQMITSGHLGEIEVSTTSANKCVFTSVTANDNLQEINNIIYCSISSNYTNTSNKYATITLSTGSSVGLSTSQFNYTQLGQSCSGTADFTFTRTNASGNGSITGKKNVSVVTLGNSIGISTGVSKDRGSWGKGTLKIGGTSNDGYIHVGNTTGKKNVSLTGSESIVSPSSTNFTVTGVLNNDIVGNDSLKGKKILNTTFTLGPGDPITAAELGYQWTFTVESGVSGVSLSNANSSTVTINYPNNTNSTTGASDWSDNFSITDGSVFPNTVSGGTTVYSCTNGYTGNQSGRILGTLSCKIGGISIGSVTVYQDGANGSTIKVSSTVSVSCTNATCTLRKSSASSGSSSVSISGGESVVINSISPTSATSGATFLGIDSSNYLVAIGNKNVSEGAFDAAQTASLKLFCTDQNTGQNIAPLVDCYYSCDSNVTITVTRTVNNTTTTSSKTLYYTGYDSSHKGQYKFIQTTTGTCEWSSGNTTYWNPTLGTSSEYTPSVTKPQNFSVTLKYKVNGTTYATGTSTIYVDSKHYYNV